MYVQQQPQRQGMSAGTGAALGLGGGLLGGMLIGDMISNVGTGATPWWSLTRSPSRTRMIRGICRVIRTDTTKVN